MTSEELDRQIAALVHELQRQRPANVAPEHVDAVAYGYYGQLQRDATVNDFIPLLVYRYTKEQLPLISRGELRQSA